MTTTTTTAPPATTTTTAAPTTTTTADPIPEMSVTIQVQRPANYEFYKNKAYYRLRFEITDSVFLPKELFVHQAKTEMTANGAETYYDWYSFAGPADLSIPVDVPDEAGFIRRSVGDVLLDNIALAAEFENKLNSAIQLLIDDMTRLHQMQPPTTYTLSNRS